MSSKNLMPRMVEGDSIDDIREVLYKKYGTDYDILDIKTVIKPGFLHLNEHAVCQVQYIVRDNQFDDLPRKQPGAVPGPAAAFPRSVPQAAGGMRPMTAAADSRFADGQLYPGLSASVAGPAASAPAASTFVPRTGTNDFALNQKKLLDSLGGEDAVTRVKLNDISRKVDSMAALLSKVSESSSVKNEQKTIVKIASLLEQNDFSQSYIEEIKERIRGEFNLDELDDEQMVMDQVVDWLGEDISIAPRFPGKKKPHIIIIVGPTGVGKTTTIAKMAAAIKTAKKDTERNAVIHMITTDSMRVAAREQLERYADAMDLIVDKADTKEDFEKILSLYIGSRGAGDYVLVDTSGFSPNDYEHISRLQNMLDVRNLKADIYLAVSATTKARDLEKIFKNYEGFGFRSVIVTKCDETTSYGNILSILHEKRKSVSWIAVGQEILHTFERADPVFFLRNLDGFDIDRAHLDKKFGRESGSADGNRE